MKLVVDANIFISALIGGKAAELLINKNSESNTPYPQKNTHSHSLLPCGMPAQ